MVECSPQPVRKRMSSGIRVPRNMLSGPYLRSIFIQGPDSAHVRKHAVPAAAAGRMHMPRTCRQGWVSRAHACAQLQAALLTAPEHELACGPVPYSSAPFPAPKRPQLKSDGQAEVLAAGQPLLAVRVPRLSKGKPQHDRACRAVRSSVAGHAQGQGRMWLVAEAPLQSGRASLEEDLYMATPSTLQSLLIQPAAWLGQHHHARL